jgi:hypothetical protein
MLASYGKRIQTIQGNGELLVVHFLLSLPSYLNTLSRHKIYDAVENCTTVSQLGRYMYGLPWSNILI